MSTADRERVMSDAELIRAWVGGWAVARAVTAPVAVDGGYRLDVGLPGHRVRYVFFDPDRPAEVVRTRTEPGTWIKTLAPIERVRPALTSAWTVGEPEYPMTGPLRRQSPAAPAGYTIEVETRDETTFGRLLAADGAVAAHGRIGVTGDTAVADQIHTDPAHRRRGLGSVVMTVLADAAAARGARTGVLVATAAGRELYRTLGWTQHGVLTAAWIPEQPTQAAEAAPEPASAQPRAAR
ncbi:GNAT family N-acetyltransferase [Embleya sp. NPDC059237]|uniref:GNAT family N-acetyltransferase n=1 Tax=Embleya sp. NPDC059237 TaxID=3346784 RepID=UPI00369FB8C1